MTRSICKTCLGKGSLPDPKNNGMTRYCDDMTCPNCDGEGFVGVPDNLFKRNTMDKFRTNDIESTKGETQGGKK